MLQIHPNARTTPVTRAEIAGSRERSGVLAQRYGVSTETIRKWRQRGAADCLDHSARPHQLPWKATEAERAVVCTLRRVSNFALDDLTFVIPHSCRISTATASGASSRPRASIAAPSQHRGSPPKARAPSRTTTLASCTSTSSTSLRSHSTRCAAGTLGCSAQAADRRWRAAQALSLRRHRPPLALGPSCRQGRRNRSQCHRFPARGCQRFSLPHDTCIDRQRQLLHLGLCQGLCRTRGRVSPYQAAYANNQWRARALQWPHRLRSARHHRL